MTTVALAKSDAEALAIGALQRLGFSADEAAVIADHLVDSELCGYPALGLSRILTIAEHPRFREPRTAPRIVHETPVSAMVDGGNTVGFYSVQWATRVAIDKARIGRIAVVGVHNNYLSGRQEGVDAIRIPSERAFRERAQRLETGFDLPRPIY